MAEQGTGTKSRSAEENPGEKTWAAFDTWHAENHKPSNANVTGLAPEKGNEE